MGDLIKAHHHIHNLAGNGRHKIMMLLFIVVYMGSSMIKVTDYTYNSNNHLKDCTINNDIINVIIINHCNN